MHFFFWLKVTDEHANVNHQLCIKPTKKIDLNLSQKKNITSQANSNMAASNTHDTTAFTKSDTDVASNSEDTTGSAEPQNNFRFWGYLIVIIPLYFLTKVIL